MIAPIKTTQSVAPSFESFIPALVSKFSYACRNITAGNDREDAVQEMLALALSYYKSLVSRNKTESVFTTPLADYAIRAFFSGRRIAGMSATDITSPRCQRLKRASVFRGFEYYGTVDNRIRSICVQDRNPQPSTIACYNIDYQNWVNSLNTKKREILFAILEEATTAEMAQRFSISPGRISQIRRELISSWKEFVGDEEES